MVKKEDLNELFDDQKKTLDRVIKEKEEARDKEINDIKVYVSKLCPKIAHDKWELDVLALGMYQYIKGSK